MSDRLLPATTVHDTIPVGRRPEPPDGRQPQLLWPSIEYREGIENCDAPRFPAMEEIRGRHNVHREEIVLKLVAFEVAVESALARVLVLDSHFDEAGVKALAPALSRSQASDERLERALRRHAGHGREHLVRQVDLIEWIALGLSGAGLGAEAISGLVDLPDSAVTEPSAPARSDSGDDDGGHLRLAALSAMSLIGGMTGNASAEDRRTLLDRLDALLVSRDPAFEDESLTDGGAHGLPASRFGHLLANDDAPAERWRRSWELLVEQRRRAQYWSATHDGDALAPTLFLLAAGTAGIDWLLAESNHGADADKAKRLWRELFEGARDCWLTMPTRPLGEDVGRYVGRLFARHPRVFGNDAGKGDASEPGVMDTCGDYGDLLARDLERLGGDDLMLAVCCLNVRHNGTAPAIIDKVLKRNSGYLDAILRRFERWQQLERRVRRRPEIVEALNELRAEIARSASPPG